MNECDNLSFLAELANNSLIEIGRHSERCRLVLELLNSMAKQSVFLPLFCPLTDQRKCVMSLLQEMSETSSHYLHTIEKYERTEESNKKVDNSAWLKKRLRKVYKKTKESARGGEEHEEQVEDGEAGREDGDAEKKVALTIVKLLHHLRARLCLHSLDYSSPILPSCSSHFPSDDSSDLQTVYVDRLRPLLFNVHPAVLFDKVGRHFYADKAEEQLSGGDIKAVFKEIAALKQSLPISLSSSIFVRYDDKHMNLLQALIVGPEQTPYANGLFLFDICFSTRYPLVPPLVNSRTNGAGRVRFNPNLYNDGKVCLSLLGTWSGERGESWNSGTSTLLQVLVSIQSLILIEDPYFNEPGYESQRGTIDGNKRSVGYNREVRANCLKWAILDQLKYPPPAFSDVVREHFSIKRDQIRRQLDKWLDLDGAVKDLVRSIKVELNKL